MRVVGGEARGRRFRAPPGRSTRPTSDRVREAIFAVLGSLPPDIGATVADATVVDLFAGSGAFGIEALSRGAARVAFVDADHRAVATVRTNLAQLGFDNARATVVRADVFGWLRSAGPADLVLADPPYAFDKWPALLELLVPVLAPRGSPPGVAVLESAAPVDPGPGWETLREKHYGGTVVVVARPARSPDLAGDQKGDT